jgi:hypothetical protein
MWQRLGKVKISCDFAILGKVMRKKDKLMVVVPSADDQSLVVICLTAVMSKPRLFSPSNMVSAGVLCGRWHITAFTGFWNFG